MKFIRILILEKSSILQTNHDQYANKVLLLLQLEESSLGDINNFIALYQLGYEILFLSDGIRGNVLEQIKSEMLKNKYDIRVLEHGCKLGKAESIYSAICYAERRGFNYIITVQVEDGLLIDHIEFFVKRVLGAKENIIYVLEHDGDQYIAKHKIPSFANHLMKSMSGTQYADLVSSVRAYPINCKPIIREVRSLDFDLEILLRATTVGIRVVPFLVHSEQNREVKDVKKSLFRFTKFIFFLFLFRMTRPIKQLLKKTS